MSQYIKHFLPDGIAVMKVFLTVDPYPDSKLWRVMALYKKFRPESDGCEADLVILAESKAFSINEAAIGVLAQLKARHKHLVETTYRLHEEEVLLDALYVFLELGNEREPALQE